MRKSVKTWLKSYSQAKGALITFEMGLKVGLDHLKGPHVEGCANQLLLQSCGAGFITGLAYGE